MKSSKTKLPIVFQWKRIQREDEPRRVSLELMLRGTCNKTRLLDLVVHFAMGFE